MCVCFVLHEATALWDVRYASATRVVSPIEQRVHSYLELLPLLAGTLLLSLHHEQALALFGLGTEPARFEFALKDPALPWPYVVAVLGAAGLFNLGPYLAELRRGLRAQHAEALKRPCQLKDAGSKATREG